MHDAASAVESASGDLRARGAPHPVFGAFDAVQWILFAAAHTDNHRPQLESLRAHPDVVAAGKAGGGPGIGTR